MNQISVIILGLTAGFIFDTEPRASLAIMAAVFIQAFFDVRRARR